MVYKGEILVWQNWKRHFFVFVIMLATICLTILPLWQKIAIQPFLFLALLYHWTLYRSDLLTIEHLILISLIQDGIYAYPLGFSALRLLIDYMLLLTQKRILCKQGFLWVWIGFGAFVGFDSFLYRSLLWFVKHEWLEILPFLPGLLMTIALYPLVIRVINKLVRKYLPA